MKLRNKETGELGINEGEGIEDKRFCIRSEKTGRFYIYNSLAELNEEWEDYVPKEPLIKDEKIRKAVRVWAEINSIEEVIYSVGMDRSACNLTDTGDDEFAIEFVGWIPTLEDGKAYAIEELCGEEEE